MFNNLFPTHWLRSFAVSSLIIALAVASTQANAKNPTSQQSEDTLEVIHVTAHRTSQALAEVPASVTVIDHESLQSLQAYTLSDLFRYEPAINVERSSSRHGDANINIRGIGGNRVLILQDGVRMPAGFGSQGIDQGTGSFSPNNLERIEVLKGPASALYGSDAIGGVVLLETLDAERLVTQNSGDTYLRASAGYSAEDERTRLSTTAAAQIGNGYGLLQLSREDFSELEVNGDFDPNPLDGDLHSVLAKWSVNTTEGVHWDFIGDYWEQEADHKLHTNLGPIAGPPGEAITESLASDSSERWRLGIHNIRENILGVDLLHWQLDYQNSTYEQYDLQLQENPGSFAPPIPVSALRTVEDESFEQDQWTFSVRIDKQLGDHHIVSGIDYLYKDFSQFVDYTTHDLINGTTSKTSRGVTYPGRSFPETKISQIGAYIQNRWEINDAFSVQAGIRYDYFESDPEGDKYYDNFNLSGTELESQSEGEWSPHLGITYQFTDEQQFYLSYQTGFRAPPVDDQYLSRAILIPVPGVPHEIVPNSNLGPETSEGYELGWRWNGAFWSASIAYYNTEYEDFIDTTTVGFREIPPVFVGPTSVRQIQYLNVDEVEIDGVELKASINLNALIDMPWQADAFLGINVIDGENKETGEGLNSVGPDTAVVGLSLVHPSDNYGISWLLRAADKADDAEPLSRRGVALEPFEPPGYGVHDLNLFWQMDDHFRIDGAVYNLFDKQYWSAHTKGGDAAGDLDAKAEPGRTFSVTLSWLF